MLPAKGSAHPAVAFLPFSLIILNLEGNMWICLNSAEELSF